MTVFEKWVHVVAATTLLLLVLAACSEQSQKAQVDTEGRAAASRAAVQAFAGELKGELVAAIKAGGPASAIGVCQQAAPAIAQSISEENGWQVARTSHRLRNPANAPDAYEASVLADFIAAREAGADPATLERYEVVEDETGARVFRYMKAIPARGPCLTCHGTNIPAEVTAALEGAYPQDQATGFAEGDIRGAFTIIQPIDG